MKLKKTTTLLLALAPMSFIHANFDFDFATADGYSSGVLSGQNGWSVFDASGVDANTFTVDTSGSGNLVIDQTESAFQTAFRDGLSVGTYYSEAYFTVNFVSGQASAVSGARALPNFQFQSRTNTTENVAGALRHLSATGGDPTNGNRFNITVSNAFNGSNVSEFSTAIDGADLGFSIDGSGNWLDAESDVLKFELSQVLGASSEWTLTTTLTNVTTSTVVGSVTQTVTDTDSSYESASELRYRIYGSNMHQTDVSVDIDKLVSSATPIVIPEPSHYAMVLGFCGFGILAVVRRRR